MALSGAIVFEVRASGGSSDNFGGGFKAGAAGTDRSQQNSAQVAIDNATITTSITTTVITFTGATYTPTSADVGNVVQMLTGTNVTAGFYEITAQTATTWTVDRNVVTSGTTVNATGNMGGALATLGKLSGVLAANQKAYVTGAFTSTATVTFAPGNVNPAGGAAPTRVIGYSATRGDTGHATLTLSTNTGLTGITCANNGFLVEQIDVDCASLGTSTGISSTGTNSGVRNCKVSNFTLRGIYMLTNAGHGVYDCEATGGTAAATAAIQISNVGEVITRCFVHDNACPAIVTSTGGIVTYNLVVNNSGASSDGVTPGNASMVTGNTIHNNGRDGIRMGGSITLAPQQWRNNILSNNGGYGASMGAATAIPATPDMDGNAYYSNTSGTRNNMDSTTGIFGVSPYTNVRDVILTASPYVGPTTGTTANFALNNTAGGGAACQGTGVPGTWPGNTGTTGYRDMGAAQHRSVSSPGIIIATG